MGSCFGCHGCAGAGDVIIATPIHHAVGGTEIHVGPAVSAPVVSAPVVTAPVTQTPAVAAPVIQTPAVAAPVPPPPAVEAKKPLIPEINPLIPNKEKSPAVEKKNPLIPEIQNPFNKGESTSAKVTVNVIADARLWVDNVECPLSGEVRTFSTPALQPGQTYYYNVVAEVNENGQRRRENQRVFVRAGEAVQVNFNNLGALAQR